MNKLKRLLCKHKYHRPIIAPIYAEGKQLIVRVCSKCGKVKTELL